MEQVQALLIKDYEAGWQPARWFSIKCELRAGKKQLSLWLGSSNKVVEAAQAEVTSFNE